MIQDKIDHRFKANGILVLVRLKGEMIYRRIR